MLALYIYATKEFLQWSHLSKLPHCTTKGKGDKKDYVRRIKNI
jgi:hypothetical protein